jgi:hypothetical protein
MKLLNLTQKNVTNLNQAIKNLENDPAVETLGPAAFQSIIYMVNRLQVKEASAMSASSPFKKAAMFMAKKDTRHYLQYIYSDGSRLIASDGHTLITIDAAYPPGFYNAAGQKVEEPDFARYPDVDRVIPKKQGKPVNLADGESSLSDGKKPEKLLRINGTAFAQKYIDRMIKAGCTEYELHPNMIVGKTDGITCIVMPRNG